MTADLEPRLLETIERLRRTMHGASDAEIHEVIIAAGLRALRPECEMLDWRPAGPTYPSADEEVLIKVEAHFSPFSVWTAFRDREQWILTDGCEPVADDCVLWWAPIPVGPRK